MPDVVVKTRLGVLQSTNLDLSKEMLHAADLIAQEMRGNVKAGIGVKEQRLAPNSKQYAKQKIAKLGHARPLIGENRSLVTPASYKIKKIDTNHIRITLPGKHPKANLSVGQIGYIHNYGLGNSPVREFAGVTKTAVKRVMAYLGDRVTRIFNK